MTELPDIEIVEKMEADVIIDDSIIDQLPRESALIQIIDEYNKFAEGLKMTIVIIIFVKNLVRFCYRTIRLG